VPVGQCLQEFLTDMQWDEDNLKRHQGQKLIAEETLGEGVFVLAERTTHGQPEERKCYWGDLPTTSLLEELAWYAHWRFRGGAIP
jgi:hypothetical protein